MAKGGGAGVSSGVVYTVITQDYSVVRRIAGLKASKVYVVIVYADNPRKVGGFLAGMSKHYNIRYKRGEPIIL